MAIHTVDEFLDFDPHLHALVADGLFDCECNFNVMRADEDGGDVDAHLAGNHATLDQLFRACMLRGWVHSGFQVHRSQRIAAHSVAIVARADQARSNKSGKLIRFFVPMTPAPARDAPRVADQRRADHRVRIAPSAGLLATETIERAAEIVIKTRFK